MWFTLNKKSRTTGKVVRCIAHRAYCESKKQAIEIARNVYRINGEWIYAFHCLTLFPYGESGVYYTLSFRKN